MNKQIIDIQRKYSQLTPENKEKIKTFVAELLKKQLMEEVTEREVQA